MFLVYAKVASQFQWLEVSYPIKDMLELEKFLTNINYHITDMKINQQLNSYNSSSLQAVKDQPVHMYYLQPKDLEPYCNDVCYVEYKAMSKKVLSGINYMLTGLEDLFSYYHDLWCEITENLTVCGSKETLTAEEKQHLREASRTIVMFKSTTKFYEDIKNIFKFEDHYAKRGSEFFLYTPTKNISTYAKSGGTLSGAGGSATVYDKSNCLPEDKNRNYARIKVNEKGFGKVDGSYTLTNSLISKGYVYFFSEQSKLQGGNCSAGGHALRADGAKTLGDAGLTKDKNVYAVYAVDTSTSTKTSSSIYFFRKNGSNWDKIGIYRGGSDTNSGANYDAGGTVQNGTTYVSYATFKVEDKSIDYKLRVNKLVATGNNLVSTNYYPRNGAQFEIWKVSGDNNKDALSYSKLPKGKYTVVTSAVDKDTKELVTFEGGKTEVVDTFTLKDKKFTSGTFEAKVKIDTTGYEDHSIVFVERVYEGDTIDKDHLIAEHYDLSSKDQTVFVRADVKTGDSRPIIWLICAAVLLTMGITFTIRIKKRA